jgi:hypothetical protein
MGQSTDAILCFGVQLDEFEDTDLIGELGIEGVETFEELIWYKLKGEIHTYDRNKLGDKSSFAKEFGVCLITHCSSEYPMYILALTETVTIANRGDVKQPIFTPIYTDDNLGKLKMALGWIQEHNKGADLPEPEIADWCLVSYWG